MNRRVILYECPTDPYVDINRGPTVGMGSYMVCRGSGFILPGNDTDEWDGVYRSSNPQYPPKFRDITDGLSNTALVAEGLLNAMAPISFQTNAAGIAMSNREPRRFAWYTAERFANHEAARFAEHCRQSSNRISVGPPFLAPHPGWNHGNQQDYDHLLPPNSIICTNGPPSAKPFARMDRLSTIPASSLHGDGGNVLFCDGSVHWVSSSIDTEVWRAFGTSDSGDQSAAF
jgi:prepilin-type processing-associated H-X9-DG protein